MRCLFKKFSVFEKSNFKSSGLLRNDFESLNGLEDMVLSSGLRVQHLRNKLFLKQDSVTNGT